MRWAGDWVLFFVWAGSLSLYTFKQNIELIFFPDNDEPRPHLPVTAVSSKQSPDGLSLPIAKPPAVGAEEIPSTDGQFYYMIVCVYFLWRK